MKAKICVDIDHFKVGSDDCELKIILWILKLDIVFNLYCLFECETVKGRGFDLQVRTRSRIWGYDKVTCPCYMCFSFSPLLE